MQHMPVQRCQKELKKAKHAKTNSAHGIAEYGLVAIYKACHGSHWLAVAWFRATTKTNLSIN